MVQNLHDVPGTHRENVYVPVIATSKADSAEGTWIAPFDCSVTGFKYSSLVAVTGHNTNSVTLEVKGVDAATTIRGSYAILVGSNLVAFVPVALGSVTAFDVDEGESLTLYNNEVGTGNAGAVGPGVWTVEYEGR